MSLAASMDKYMDERFDRVQRALTSLIDSITKYTPSTTQANDLATADKELSDGLHELEKHQNNYLRIQQLKKETDDLDAQIKSTVTLLWSTRKEITGTPTTTYPSSGPRHDFTYPELLNYARRIARYTIPPAGVTNGVDLSTPAGDTTQQPSAEQTPVTATAPSNPITNGVVPTPADAPSQPPPDGIPAPEPATAYPTSLPAHMHNLTNLITEGSVFFPWPGEDRIRGGGLDICQRLVAAGVDPKGYDPEEVERQRQAEAEERKRQEAVEDAERERRERERVAQMVREREERERERARMAEEAGGGQGQEGQGGGHAGGAARQGQPKQFQFMGGLGDDDSDED